jgi:arylsulfatase A-like enzyme
MRRDRVSAYGYPRATTPFLDSMLDGSLHCTSAHSVAPWTCPAVVSLHTGLYPHRHGGGLVPGTMKSLSKQNLPTLLPAGVPALPLLLAAKGYRTAAMIAVWNAHLPMPGRFALEEMVERPARRMVERGLRWVSEGDAPFFLWLHLGDCHEPLDVPRSMKDVFGKVRRNRRTLRWDFTHRGDDVASEGFRRYREARIRLYDVAVRSVDEALSGLWRGLEATGHRDDSILVVTADHGEELWEHRQEEIASFADPRDVAGTGHGHNLFQVHLLIPLVIVGAGIDPRHEEANVSLVDVMPTVLEAAGLDAVPTDGRSLLEDGVAGPVLAEGVAYGYEKKSVILGDLKLLHAPDDGYERVFRLGPERLEAGAVEDPEAKELLRSYLPKGPSAMGEQVDATEEIEGHLRALGYIE